ncbi:MAG: hypothetical protein ACTHN0_18725 [Aquihabitans sp.]
MGETSRGGTSVRGDRFKGSGGSTSSPVDRSPSEHRTIRPHLFVLVGMPAIAVWMIVAVTADPSQEGLSELFGTAFLGAIGAFAAAVSIRERVVVAGDEVRVIRLFTQDRLDRSDVDHVARSGGRGRPAHIVLRSDAVTNNRYLDLGAWPPRFGRHAGLARLPAFMTARRLATALGVPLTTYRGKLRPTSGWDELAPNLWTGRGHLRPYSWVVGTVIAIGVGLVIAWILYGPGR